MVPGRASPIRLSRRIVERNNAVMEMCLVRAWIQRGAIDEIKQRGVGLPSDMWSTFVLRFRKKLAQYPAFMSHGQRTTLATHVGVDVDDIHNTHTHTHTHMQLRHVHTCIPRNLSWQSCLFHTLVFIRVHQKKKKVLFLWTVLQKVFPKKWNNNKMLCQQLLFLSLSFFLSLSLSTWVGN